MTLGTDEELQLLIRDDKTGFVVRWYGGEAYEVWAENPERIVGRFTNPP